MISNKCYRYNLGRTTLKSLQNIMPVANSPGDTFQFRTILQCSKLSKILFSQRNRFSPNQGSIHVNSKLLWTCYAWLNFLGTYSLTCQLVFWMLLCYSDKTLPPWLQTSCLLTSWLVTSWLLTSWLLTSVKKECSSHTCKGSEWEYTWFRYQPWVQLSVRKVDSERKNMFKLNIIRETFNLSEW